MAKTLTEIPSLPRQTGTLNAFTFDLVHKVILAQGKKKGLDTFSRTEYRSSLPRVS